MFLFNGITKGVLRQFTIAALSCIAFACVLPIGLASAEVAPSPALMIAPMSVPVPVEIPVPVPATIVAPSQHGRQAELLYQPDQPDLSCLSIEDHEAAAGVDVSPEAGIERRSNGGCK